MPIICLGPICFPIWGLIPVVLVFAKQIWHRAKVFLGYAKPDADKSEEINTTLSKLDSNLQHVVTLKSADQLALLKHSSQMKSELLVVKVGANFCQPCKAIQPFYEQLSASSEATFCTVTIDEEGMDPELKKLATTLPTFIIYKNKEELQRMTGADENRLFSFLQVQFCSRVEILCYCLS